MANLAHDTLRRKLGGLRIARPPVADVAQLAELFARLLEDRFRGVLHIRPHVRVEAASPQRQADAMAHIAPYSLLAVPSIDGTEAGCAAFSPKFAFRMIEMMTGVIAPPADQAGDTDPTSEGPVRRLTPIDKVLLQYPAAAVFGAFIDAMPTEPPVPVQTALSKPMLVVDDTAANIDAAENEGDGEPGVDGLAITLSVTLSGAEDVFAMPVFIPLTTLDLLEGPPSDKPSASTDTPSVWSRTMLAAARNAGFRMVGVLHEKKMSIGDIRDMQVGSVIPLPLDHKMQIDLRVDTPNGVTLEPTVGGGVLGVIDGQRAVRLTAPPDETFLSHLEILRP